MLAENLITEQPIWAQYKLDKHRKRLINRDLMNQEWTF